MSDISCFSVCVFVCVCVRVCFRWLFLLETCFKVWKGAVFVDNCPVAHKNGKGYWKVLERVIYIHGVELTSKE